MRVKGSASENSAATRTSLASVRRLVSVGSPVKVCCLAVVDGPANVRSSCSVTNLTTVGSLASMHAQLADITQLA